MKNSALILLIAIICTLPASHLVSCNTIEGNEEQSIDSFPMTLKSHRLLSDINKDGASVKKQDSVLICNSKNAYAYHNSYCAGLSRCKAGVSKVTKNEAVNYGYSPCKFCY